MKSNGWIVSLVIKTVALPVILFLPAFCIAAVRHVPSEYSSIQGAIDAASEGDEIVVSPDTYYENINFGGKNIILRSTEPTSSSVVASTIISGPAGGPVVTFSGSELTSCILSGFTIRNGYALDGGGIFGNGTQATIQYNRIIDNHTKTWELWLPPDYHGGGLYNCDGIIMKNLIANNEAPYGAGLYGCDGVILGNTISHNHAYGYYEDHVKVEIGGGGGLYDCDASIMNNIISDNSAVEGGSGLSWCDGTIQNNLVSGNLTTHGNSYGGGFSNCNGTLLNNTIVGNSAKNEGGGLYRCSAYTINCIIWGNSAPAGSQLSNSNTPFSSCIQNWSGGGRGNISADPSFVDSPSKNYRLQPDSPCIDTGDIYYLFGEYIADLDSNCRVAGSSVDIGCYEFASTPDSDGDLLADTDEATQASDPDNPDTDGDGLQDGIELMRGTDLLFPDTPATVSIPAQYPSTQQALFLAFHSEAIVLSPGTYYENLHFLGKNVILQSNNPFDDAIVSSTILDGNAAFSVIFFEGTEGESCAVKGLTIRNGTGAAYGGGICGNGTLATIENSKIVNNSAREVGGGLYDCDGTIQNNIISTNTATDVYGNHGGGLAYCDGTIQNNTISYNIAKTAAGLYTCNGFIFNNVIYNNSAVGWLNAAGGLGDCDGIIQNNVISLNSSQEGGGLTGCDGVIVNNSITGNHGSYGGGLHNCYATIENNTISGNVGSYGGGLYGCDNTIVNNIINNNRGDDNGGGLCECNGTIEHNTISGNLSRYGGGLSKCNGTIQNNSISRNSFASPVGSLGGGLYRCDGTIQDNTISLNSTRDYGGGLWGCNGAILNNTIWGNSADYSGGGLSNCNGTITNCIIWKNSAPSHAQLHECITPSYSCIQYWTDSGTGNISANPQLVDPFNDDFHLHDISPCIDAGCSVTLSQDFEGDVRPFNAVSWESRGDGSDIDIGADEFIGTVPIPTPTPIPTPCIIHVPQDYSTIQSAIDVAHDGCVIVVSQGRYVENIKFKGRDIILRSSDPTSPTVVLGTIIDGNHAGAGVTFSGAEETSCVLSGFTITNGYELNGGGIYGNGTLATIRDNNIITNTAYGIYHDGIGGALYRCNGTIQNNVISANSAKAGGGVGRCTGSIENNIIFANLAVGQYGSGGGLSDCQGIIQNNTIYANSAQGRGGGLGDCDGTIRNCIIWQNTSPGGTQLSYCSTPLYSCIQDWTGEDTGNFADYPLLSDPRNGDFHLDYDSPCIDAGCYVDRLLQDFEGDSRGHDGSPELRGDGSDYDMGADEFISVPSNHPPHKPTNLSPHNGQTGVSLPATLESSPFTDPNPGDLHTASQWQIDNNSDFSSPEYDSGPDYFNKITILASSEDLVYSTDYYYWRVRHRDTHGYWSEWSDATAFLTLSPGMITVPDDYSTIQAAIDAASHGDHIIVSPGTYPENINFLGKNIIVRSTDATSPSVVASTIIDGNGLGSVVTFSGSENENCVLSGFTITNGSADWGGGILGNSTRATIQNNSIFENQAKIRGGGLFTCHGTIRNNTISRNSSEDEGGGLGACNGTIQNNIIWRNSGGGLWLCDGTIENNTISRNWAEGSGGSGLSLCDGIVRNNLISGNSAYRGGGLSACNGTIENNTIYGNGVLDQGGGLYDCNGTVQNNTVYGNRSAGGGGLSKCNGIIRNCIVWQNTTILNDQLRDCASPSYSCIENWQGGGTGNFSWDPLLIAPEQGDFHLLPSSPCIDAGCHVEALTEDFEGDPRPINGSLEARGDGSDFDIGADEYRGPLASEAYDFNLTNEGWNAVTVPGFTPPYFYYIPGQIKFAAQDNTNTYGYWTSEEDAVPVIADCLYRASWTVATDVSDRLAVPTMRLRVNSQNLQQADMLVVSSCGDGSYAPTADGRTYEMYFIPPESALGKPEDQDDLILSFDIMNFDPGDAANGSLLLDSVVIDIIALNALGASTPLKTWNFDADAEGWQYGSAPLFFTEPVHDNIGGALWLIAQDNTNTFGFWSGPPNEVQIEADKLYRVRFSVSSDVTERELVPGLRLRVHSEDFQAGIVKVISSVMGGEMSPTLEGRTYNLYFYPPQSLVGTDADSIIVAFDILNFDPTDAATGALMLNSVVLESLDVP